MKRFLTFLLLISCFLLGQNAFSQNSGAHIQARVKGFSGGTVRVIGMIGNQNYLVDSILATGEDFTYQNKSALQGGLYYFVFPKNQFIQLLIDQDQDFSLETDFANIVGAMKVTGSLDNELFYENQQWEEDFQKRITPVLNELKTLDKNSADWKRLDKEEKKLLQERKDKVESYRKKYPQSFFTVFKLAGQNPDPIEPKKPNGDLDTLKQLVDYRNHYWDDVDFADERLLRTPVIHNKLKTYITQLVPQTPDSVVRYSDWIVDKSQANPEMFKFIANFIAVKYQKSNVMGMEAVYVNLVDKYFTYEKAFWSDSTEIYRIRKDALERKPSLLGKTGQDITCIDLNGNSKSLYDLKGKLIILYMYSYDCSHCRKHTPELVELYKTWHPKGLEIYALNLDKDQEKWKAFVEKNGMEVFTNVYDPNYKSLYYKKWHVDITPEIYVMKPDHMIIAKDLKPFQLEAVFKKNLGEL
ncbi:MAG: redoxin domain-containing protein [Bacteroidia bacterium]|nr:redoxin domain-containing protein [Bacteroidia bacterium]